MQRAQHPVPQPTRLAGEIPAADGAPAPDGHDSMGDYARIARAIEYLGQPRLERPALADLARAVQLGEYPFRRLLGRWAGTSAERCLQALLSDPAGSRLAECAGWLASASAKVRPGDDGLPDPSLGLEVLDPGKLRPGGDGREIRYGHPASPFGWCRIAASPRGVCLLEFDDREEAGGDARRKQMEARWPGAHWVRDEAFAARLARRVFTRERRDAPLAVSVHGTPFQARVWSALRRIPPGRTATYAQVAVWIGQPGAARAVGGAVGANPVAWLIPCHRVLRADGQLGGYAWGATRKRACLAWEMAAAAGDNS